MHLWPFRQWPTGNIGLGEAHVDLRQASQTSLAILEQRLSRLFKFDVLLLPSARSALRLLSDWLQLERADRIYIPPFSSQCLYDAFSHRATLTTDSRPVSVELICHKWGLLHSNATHGPLWTIEDGCDGAVGANGFQWNVNGDFGVVSLPKVLGCVSGGLILARKIPSSLSGLVRSPSTAQVSLAIHQAQLKFQDAEASFTMRQRWEYLEPENRTVTSLDIASIERALSRYPESFERLCLRRNKIEEIITSIETTENELGPVVMIPNRSLTEDLYNAGCRTYHYDLSRSNGCGDYTKVLAVPIHAGVSHAQFEQISKALVTM